MAVTLLRVLVLGVIAAAADDVPITWWGSSRVFLPCVVPNAEKIVVRRPPPLLDDDDQTISKPYIWRKNKEEVWSKITKNGTLEVSKKKDGSTEGVYQCTVRHQAGLVLGYPVHLKFAYLNKQFAVRPQDVTVNAGQPILLNCEISSGPAANITWMKNGDPLPLVKRYHLLKNQLLILDTTIEDTGFYRCRASNPQANKTRTSHGGRVQVQNENKDTPLAFLPLQQEQNIAVPRGDDVLLACPIAGRPRPKFLWQFTAPGARTAEYEDVDEIFTIEKVDLDSEGVYSCTVEGRSEFSKSFNISITEPVNITIPPTSKTISLANTVRFNCTATGRPEPTITWYKDGVPLVLENRIMVRKSVNGDRMELLIRHVTSEDAGVYQCVASNSISSASSWASLNVTGAAAAPPQGVMCAPVGLHNISVRWDNMTGVIAFTVHTTAPGVTSLPILPVVVTEDFVSVKDPFVPYTFQVRAYLASKENTKSAVSEMSANVTCYGQGVPVKLARTGDDVTVSWRQFSDHNPEVKQWVLQYKTENSSQVTNITLGPDAYKYTVKGASPDSLQVRVLGTKQLPWLHQNLTLVPWTSTNTAHNFNDEIKAIPEAVTVTDVGPNHFAITWQCKEAEKYPEVSYLVCTTDQDEKQECVESHTNSAYVGNLTQNSEYEIRVLVQIPSINLKGKFTQPIYISTQSKGPQKFKDLTYKLVNDTTLRVSWSSNPDKYIIYYSNDLTQVPVNQWPYVETVGNTVLLTGVDLSRELYVMVTGYEPLGRSPILTVPPQVTVPATEEEENEVQYSYTSNGILLSWSSNGPRLVKYSQNLTHFLENWIAVNVTGNTVELTDLSPSLDTFVAVSDTNVLTVPPRPHVDHLKNILFLCIGIAGALLFLFFVVFCGIYIWRKRKNARSPMRARRRHNSPGQDNVEENAEMKSVGGRLANGGNSKDAGEPLLNGHVNITENPNQSKTPNGRMRIGRRYEPSFDVARYEDPDTTLETVLDADTSATSFNLLDTSRIPDYDVTKSSRLTTNDSYNKLPDDNMNSELRSTSQIDDGKILPTLQPNG